MRPLRSAVFCVAAIFFVWARSTYAADAFFETTHFSGSGTCGFCHNGLVDATGNDVSIESDWSATMMANSARDPFWQAKFASELIRSPGLADVLNDKCTRCHAPMANEESAYSADPGATLFFGEGFVDPSNVYHDAAMDGVSCTLCHQIADDSNLGTPAGSSGQFTIEEFTNVLDRLAYGKYANPAVNPMRRNSGFTPQHSAHVSDSALCATCHNLMTPVLDSTGQVIPDREFPEQAVYTEWQNSAFADGRAEATSCQDCHMGRVDGVKIANRPLNLPRRNAFGRHGFYGGNTLMLDILAANRAALGVGDGDFAASIEATRANLRSAAELAIEEATLDAATNELLVRVRVTNNTGHKLPTSYPSRRIYVHLKVSDPAGATLFESGRLRPTGQVVGVNADIGAGFEPHQRGEITKSGQVQVYEAIMGDSDGNLTYTLLRASAYLKDNRIPPRGFDDQAVPDEVAVIGVGKDPNFVAGSDLVTYRIQLPAGSGGVTVAAELNYQSLAYGYLRDLQKDAADPTVARFLAMYDASKVRVETMASATAEVWPSVAP
jgi:hypothetical protein